MDTKCKEKKQEVLISLMTTAGTLNRFSKKAKSKNMTLGEFALYALDKMEEKAKKELAPSEIKPTSK